ncbi:hypothetical protein, partial [Bradyrhizobium sp.]|uniref:hypothetical protein n=1 Tax=Bradyrhizobium sp. TaxID=376 RepID=UPI003C7767CE
LQTTGFRLAATHLSRRSAFKQSVADLLRYEALRPLPCLVIVTAESEELLEQDALGCCIDGSSPHVLHQRAYLLNDADDQDLRAACDAARSRSPNAGPSVGQFGAQEEGTSSKRWSAVTSSRSAVMKARNRFSCTAV